MPEIRVNDYFETSIEVWDSKIGFAQVSVTIYAAICQVRIQSFEKLSLNSDASLTNSNNL